MASTMSDPADGTAGALDIALGIALSIALDGTMEAELDAAMDADGLAMTAKLAAADDSFMGMLVAFMGTAGAVTLAAGATMFMGTSFATLPLRLSVTQPSTGPAQTDETFPVAVTALVTQFWTCSMHETKAGPYEVALLKYESSAAPT